MQITRCRWGCVDWLPGNTDSKQSTPKAFSWAPLAARLYFNWTRLNKWQQRFEAFMDLLSAGQTRSLKPYCSGKQRPAVTQDKSRPIGAFRNHVLLFCIFCLWAKISPRLTFVFALQFKLTPAKGNMEFERGGECSHTVTAEMHFAPLFVPVSGHPGTFQTNLFCLGTWPFVPTSLMEIHGNMNT